MERIIFAGKVWYVQTLRKVFSEIQTLIKLG
jgi:hypothetical protein